MAQVVIEDPVINSPYEEPRRHFRFSDEGITDEIVESRRPSSYFVPIPAPRKKGRQLTFDTEWTNDRVEENHFINQVRDLVARWRQGGYVGVTKTTRRLLEYWCRPDRDPQRRLFFCQIEAAETAIYLTEVAPRYDGVWVLNKLREENERSNSTLHRVAFKMATAAGKTVVMAMLIAWHALNKLHDAQDARFSDAFLIVTPGITIRDRLRVLLPNDPQNYFRQRDVVPADWMEELGRTKVTITNFHSLLLRARGEAAAVTKSILRQSREESPFTETPAQMIRRVCHDLGSRRNIVVINDEAHHCYRPQTSGDDVRLTGDERKEVERLEEEARVWISGLEAVKEKIGVRVVYDLSATPFFLRGSGYREGTLFRWVVSDFSLIDAIESGIVKVPRVPVADDSVSGDQPTYRDLWARIRDGLPKKGRKTEAVTGEPKLPAELEGALHSLYGNYEKHYQLWEQNTEGLSRGHTPPVFIVVCNNTNVSKLVFDYVAGWEKTLSDGSKVLVPGALPIFSNVDDGRWRASPNTILVDSQQLESGEAMSPDFKKMAAAQIEEFKVEYRTRFPGRGLENLTDEDLLREVMNTVGKPGKLGEDVKCVVSVSMLTEGWDANTVTHILGVRAFGTQLLCEQVIGRGLRRMSYATDKRTLVLGGRTVEFDALPTEYAEVYGVPFSFIPCSRSNREPKPGRKATRVRALEERVACEITFPRLMGYRYDLPSEHLDVSFSEASMLVLSTEDLPTETEVAPILGESEVDDLEALRDRREQEVGFRLAKLTLEKYFRADDGAVKQWLFPQVLAITRRWLRECVVLKDKTFPQLLLFLQFAHDAADRIYRAVVASSTGEKAVKPIMRPYDPIGSTRYVDFDTTRDTYQTSPNRCHVSHVVLDSNWEAKLAQSLEGMSEILRYVRNQGLGFAIPYTIDGEERAYLPDYIAVMDDGHGPEDPLNLVLEVTGEPRKDKVAKVDTARTFWVPAVNNHGGLGRWAFIEVCDPWDAQNAIRAMSRRRLGGNEDGREETSESHHGDPRGGPQG